MFVCFSRVLLRVGRGLATGAVVQGVLTTVYRIKELKKLPRPYERAVEPLFLDPVHSR
jgi:hypothetical protein